MGTTDGHWSLPWFFVRVLWSSFVRSLVPIPSCTQNPLWSTKFHDVILLWLLSWSQLWTLLSVLNVFYNPEYWTKIKVTCLSLWSFFGVCGVKAVHQTGHPLLQCVQCVMLRVVTTETVPQAAQSVSHQLQLVPLTNTESNNITHNERKLLDMKNNKTHHSVLEHSRWRVHHVTVAIILTAWQLEQTVELLKLTVEWQCWIIKMYQYALFYVNVY